MNTKLPKDPVYTEYLPPGPKFSFVLLYDQLFSGYKDVKNRKNYKEMHWIPLNYY